MEKYNVIKEIGRGGEGVVLLVKRKDAADEDDFLVMKKRICVSFDEANAGLQEAVSMAKIQSQFVVTYHDVFLEAVMTTTGGLDYCFLCIVMEYCKNGDVQEYLYQRMEDKKSKPHRTSHEDKVLSSQSSFDSQSSDDFFHRPVDLYEKLDSWVYQLCQGVHAIHSLKLIHRDLKCANVFISDSYSLKIGDFGLAQLLHGKKSKEVTGTLLYMAPEILKGEPYNLKADIWSLGIVLLELVNDKLLAFYNSGKSNMTSSRIIGEEALKDDYNPSNITKDLPKHYHNIASMIEKMLIRDPNKRPTMDILISTEPFFQIFMGAKHDSLGEISQKLIKLGISDVNRRQLTKHNSKEASAVLVHALSNDPRFVNLLPDQKQRVEFLGETAFPTIMGISLKYGRCTWGLYVDSVLRGVAVWFPPDTTLQRRPWKLVKTLWKSNLKLKEMRRIAKMLAKLEKEFHMRVNQPHYGLFYAGIEPSFQNKQLGQEMLKPVLEWADQDQYPAATFTFNERNLDFFARLGFKILEKVESSGFLPFWILMRKPKPQIGGRLSSSNIEELNVKKQ